METKPKTIAAISGAHMSVTPRTFPNVDIVDLSKDATKSQGNDAFAIAHALDILAYSTGTVSHMMIYDDGTISAWMGWHSERAALLDTGKPRTVKRSVLAVRNALRVFGKGA